LALGLGLSPGQMSGGGSCLTLQRRIVSAASYLTSMGSRRKRQSPRRLLRAVAFVSTIEWLAHLLRCHDNASDLSLLSPFTAFSSLNRTDHGGPGLSVHAQVSSHVLVARVASLYKHSSMFFFCLLLLGITLLITRQRFHLDLKSS